VKQRLYLVQVNNRYGENVYVPYSVGLLWAYARTFKEITDAYEMVDFLYLKESIDKAVEKIEAPDLIGLSCYIWNWEWCKAFSQAIKMKWPNCVIVVGGVQVQDESPKILEEHPYFDFAIYGEGEGAFANFLKVHALDTAATSYASVKSLIYRTYNGIVVNPRREFVPLDALRSPYLDGVFDELWSREPRWQVLQETARGCPYACSFCSWGQAALTELRPFSEERVVNELKWFGQHKVDYLDNADANYGILKRDIALTRVLAETKTKYGYPKTFRTSFAKNSNDTIWEIANILHKAKMLKSVTLAMQSMDDGVLINIKRKNIKFSKFGELITRYETAGIPTYTELILGLPGESLQMFIDGIDRNLEAGQHSGLFCYLNIMLNNTEQNTPEYITAHGLETRLLEAMLTHGTPDPTVIREKQEIIIATKAMPHADWKRAYVYSKVIEIFHAQGLLQDVAVALNTRGVKYSTFYTRLIDWCHVNQDMVAGWGVRFIEQLLDKVLTGGSWDCVDPMLGDISWPPEEFVFAKICCQLETFYDEIWPFLKSFGAEKTEIEKQARAITPPAAGFVAEWAREVVWYGRKGYHKKMKRAS